MSSARSITTLDPSRSVVEQLRERVAAMERKPAGEPVATLPGLADAVPLRAGGDLRRGLRLAGPRARRRGVARR